MPPLKCRIALVFAVVVASRVAAADAVIEASDVSFGLVDNGASAVRYVNVSNTGASVLTITAATLGDNAAGWFSFAGNGCAGTGSCTLAPPLSLTTFAGLVAIRCTPPPSSMGTQTATVSFTSNASDSTHGISTLICTAGGGVVDLTPASSVLEFGAVDLAHVPVSVTSLIRIGNTGTAAFTLGAGAPSGVDVARFTFTSLAAQVVQPGGTFDVTVTYTPIAERAAANPDLASLAFTVTGAVGATAITIVLRGHGVTRHAALTSVPTFPDTFRNPGTTAPVLPVTIANTGEAVLGVTGATLIGAPSWALLDPDPADVPGFASYDVHVAFTPVTAGPAPAATLTIGTTDPANPSITVQLPGNGLDRDVAMGPPTIDLGYAGIGETARISDGTRGQLVTIANLDATNTFTIRSIDVTDAAFAIPGAAGIALAPNSSQTFDVELTPSREGAFDASALLYLDQDPTPQSTIALTGQGVFVDVHGGGGCSTTGGGGGLAVVLVVLLAMRRRRIAIACLGFVATAHADTRNLDVGVFDPTPATTVGTLQVQTAEVGNEGDWAASALLSYASDPLVLDTSQNENISIQDRATLVLGGAFAFGDRFEAGARIPLYLQSGENLNSTTMFGEPAASGAAHGDLAIHAKARIWQHRGPAGELVTGASVALALPTETDQEFAGSGKPSLRALGLATYTPNAGKLFAIANAGAVARTRSQWHDIDQGSGFAWGLGAGVRVLDTLIVEAELFGELDPSAVHDAPAPGAAMGPAKALDTIEWLAGIHYQLERHLNLALAVGRGVTSGLGSPSLAGVFALTFTPTSETTVSVKHVSGDRDHDGIPDDVDRCPDQPEDRDGWQDEDGCPDPDNDGDGIPDALDKCPNEPEDKDGFEDENGCPDPDNDRDGIPDAFDHPARTSPRPSTGSRTRMAAPTSGRA